MSNADVGVAGAERSEAPAEAPTSQAARSCPRENRVTRLLSPLGRGLVRALFALISLTLALSPAGRGS